MTGFETILTNIATLSLAMFVGFICIKTGYITNEQKNALSQIIIKITLPILVMNSLTKLELNHEKMMNCLFVIGISLLVIGFMYFVGWATGKRFHMERKKQVVHECMTAFGNVVFLGYPLIQAIYGDEGLLYAALYAFANDVFVWTLAVYKLASIEQKETGWKNNLKNLINPSTIAFGIAFFMMIFKLHFSGVVATVLSGIGGTTTYLSMLFIGGTLALVDFKQIYKRVSLLVLTVFKMLIVPTVLIFLFCFLSVPQIVSGVIILQVAMPSQTVLTILTTQYHGDVLYSAEGVFVTTIASIVTLPVIYYFMQLIPMIYR